MALPDPLVTAKQMASGSVSFQKKVGFVTTGKAQERLIPCSFPTADAPVPFRHNLGHLPTGFTPVAQGKAKIYSDIPIRGDMRNIILYCDTAGTTAYVIVR